MIVKPSSIDKYFIEVIMPTMPLNDPEPILYDGRVFIRGDYHYSARFKESNEDEFRDFVEISVPDHIVRKWIARQ